MRHKALQAKDPQKPLLVVGATYPIESPLPRRDAMSHPVMFVPTSTVKSLR